MSDRAYVVFDDIVHNAQDIMGADSPDAQNFWEPENILASEPDINPRYGTVSELNQLILNDNFAFIPESYMAGVDESWAFISDFLCDEECVFHEPPLLTIKSTNSSDKVTSKGVTIAFDLQEQNYATEIQLTWLRDGSVLSQAVFHPHSVEYYAEQYVSDYDELQIRILKWILPVRYARINYVRLGDGFFVDKFLNIVVRQEVSPISAQIAINTLDFTTSVTSEKSRLPKRGDQISAYFGSKLIGVFFVNTIERLSAKNYVFRASDYVSILDSTEHEGGIYTNKSSKELVMEIMETAGVPVEYEAYDIQLSGWLPYDSARNNLAQVCFASGIICDTSYAKHVRIYNARQSVSRVLERNQIFLSNSKFKELEPPSSVSLSAYRYYLGDPVEDWVEIFSEEKAGEIGRIKVIFSTTYRNLEIENGVIVRFGDNWAEIDALEGCILKGTPYFRTSMTTMQAINTETPTEPLVIEKPSLITRNRVNRLLDSVYSYVSNPYSVNFKTTESAVRCGDVVGVTGTYLGSVMGTVEKLELNLNGTKLCPKVEMTVRTTNLLDEYPRAGFLRAGALPII